MTQSTHASIHLGLYSNSDAAQAMSNRYGYQLERLSYAQKLAIVALLSQVAFTCECSPADEWSVDRELQQGYYSTFINAELGQLLSRFDEETVADAVAFVGGTIALMDLEV